MKHDEWKAWRCPIWDFDCDECLRKMCLDDPEYEPEELIDENQKCGTNTCD